MKKNLKEELSNVSELIRQAYNLINPEEENHMHNLFRKDIKQRMYGQHPKCFLKLLPIGQDTSEYLMPMCNRGGFEDFRVIHISMSIIQHLMDQQNSKFDVNSLQSALDQLQHKHNTLSQTVPKPQTMAARKAHVTRMFNNIKGYLDMIKSGEI